MVSSPSGLRAREARCDLRCQYFYEDSRQCELACFLTLAHHSQLGYMHICEQHYGCVTDDEEDACGVESTVQHERRGSPSNRLSWAAAVPPDYVSGNLALHAELRTVSRLLSC